MSGAFSPGKHRILAALVEALVADVGADGQLVPPSPELRDRVVGEFDAWIASGGSTLPTGLGLLILVLESLPLTFGRRSRMSKLPLAERVAFLEDLETARLGLLVAGFVGLKIPLLMLAYEHGELLHETGYDRPDLASRRVLPIVGPT